VHWERILVESFIGRRLAAAGAIVIASLALASTASAAYQTTGVAVTEHVTGFAFDAGGTGPIGIAFDKNNRLFVTSRADDWLYRFDGPGTATPAQRVGIGPIPGGPAGLAFDPSGKLYLARQFANDIVELNPETGTIVRTIADQVSCPHSLAADPISGGLVVATHCASEVVLITDLASKSPKKTVLAKGPYEGNSHADQNMDAVAVAADGTVFATSGPAIVRVNGQSSANPGEKKTLALLAEADGIVVGLGANGKPAFLLVSRENGVITRVDLSSSPATTEDVVTGGSEGEVATVDQQGCLYVAQSDSIIKVTDPDGSCTKVAGGALVTTTPSVTTDAQGLPEVRGCVDRRKFTWRLHHAKSTTVVSVQIFVNGKRNVHRRGKNIETVSLKRLPEGIFRVRIVSTHSDGRRIISTRRYKGCKKGKPRSRRGR
jgi:hypothetical protein